MVVSAMHLVQCTSLPSQQNASTAVPQATNQHHTYPATRSFFDKEDRFLTGEFGRPDNLSSEGNVAAGRAMTVKRDDAIDHYYGEKVVDKYRWLEDINHISPEYATETDKDRQRNFIGTRLENQIPNNQLDDRSTTALQQVDEKAPLGEIDDWVNAQNTTTRNYLNAIPFIDKVRANIDSLYDRHHLIRKHKPKAGGEIELFRGADTDTRIIYTDSKGKQIQLWSEQQSGKVLTQGDMYVSKDGTYVALLLSSGYADSDQVKLHVLETTTGKEVITPIIVGTHIDSFHINMEWYDDDTFFYGTFLASPNPYLIDILRHDIGKKRLNDPIEVSYQYVDDKLMKDFYFHKTDKRYLIIDAYHKYSETFFIKDLKTGKLYQPHDKVQADKQRPYNEGFILAKYVHLDEKTGDLWLISGENDDQRGELIKTNLNNLNKREVVVPINTNYDSMVSAIRHQEGAGYFAINYLKDGQHRLVLTDHRGKFIKELTPHTVGQISDLDSFVADNKADANKSGDDKVDENHIYFRFQNTTTPRTVYKYSVTQDRFIDIRRRDLFPFDHDEYVSELVKYTSKDGTEVPMTIAYKKGTVLDGKNPTLLTGYGGFNVKIDTNFRIRNAPWLEHGGIIAQPHLRGGGEYGKEWHKAGQLQDKMNVFDDFEAAADYLFDKGYTSPSHLAIMGGSNGGLLVGAAMTLTPNKYRVALPQVGVLDMLRHDQFTYKGVWVKEYGSAYDSPSMYRYLKSYSPYHNVKSGVCYPSTIVMTSKRDDRVLPAHSYKFAAALQEHQSCANPTFLFADEDQGHGARSPKPLKEAMTIQTAFSLYEMGIKDVPVVERPSVETLKGEKWLAEEAEEAAKSANK